MQSETGFPSSHQLKSYVAFKSRLKLAARAVLSADAGLLVQPWSRSTIMLSWRSDLIIKNVQSSRWTWMVYSCTSCGQFPFWSDTWCYDHPYPWFGINFSDKQEGRRVILHNLWPLSPLKLMKWP